MKNFLIIILFVSLFQPVNSQNGNRPRTSNNTLDSSELYELQKQNVELNKAIEKEVFKPRIEYKVKLKEVKPKSIILYIKDSLGNITEHKIESDHGYYIVYDTLFTNRDTVIEDTLEKKTFWQRFKR